MNFIDLIFIVILLWSAYRGFTKGFILQLSTLAALLLGILGAIKFSDFTAQFLTDNFNLSSNYLNVIAFAVTFIIIVIAVHLLAKVIEKLMQAIALGFINKILGIVFGIAKTAFIISIILVLVNKANNKYHFLPKETTNSSYLYQPLSNFAPMIFPYLKFDELKDELKQEDKETEQEDKEQMV
ncbi:MAG: CvpA family protein [Bacteroidales bacterium]|nr:CvpA family protein [Bacteroidales bacterium]